MNIDDMTPEELREYAARKEQRAQEIRAAYLQEEPAIKVLQPEHEPWEKRVDVDDLTVWVDMRRMKSRRAVVLLNAYNNSIVRHQDGTQQAGITETLNLIDYLFSGEVDKAVEAYVVEKMGYDDAETIYGIEGRIMEQLDAKN